MSQKFETSNSIVKGTSYHLREGLTPAKRIEILEDLAKTIAVLNLSQAGVMVSDNGESYLGLAFSFMDKPDEIVMFLRIETFSVDRPSESEPIHDDHPTEQ